MYKEESRPHNSVYVAIAGEVINRRSVLKEVGAVLSQANSLSEFVQKIATVPLYYELGTTFEYSYSTDILGYLIEKLSGQTLREFFIENIFVPLNMDDTDFYIPEEKKDRLANLYKYESDSLILTETYENSIYKELPKIYSAGGGLVSTVKDYAKFLQMLLNYGKYQGIDGGFFFWEEL